MTIDRHAHRSCVPPAGRFHSDELFHRSSARGNTLATIGVESSSLPDRDWLLLLVIPFLLSDLISRVSSDFGVRVAFYRR